MSVAEYLNGNTRVTIDLSNGTKSRFTEDDEFKPEFAEAMDVTITYQCDGDCPFCYAGCTRDGKHADLKSDYVVNTFIPSLKPYTEIALNGNDLSHPDLEDFLEMLNNQKVIANLTVNQKHFMRNIDKLHDWTDRNLIHGLGVSLTNPTKEFIKELKKFPNAVLHTIAGVITLGDIRLLSYNDIKLLILGYKLNGRGEGYFKGNVDKIRLNVNMLEKILPSMIAQNMFSVISFDTLALEQLHVNLYLTDSQWESFYQGEEGSFTFFVDLVENRFAKNSMELDTIHIDGRDAVQMFNKIREV